MDMKEINLSEKSIRNEGFKFFCKSETKLFNILILNRNGITGIKELNLSNNRILNINIRENVRFNKLELP